ncbi:MBL fold metallo-hydrolase RNA specificity domain-containing protein [Flavobacterium crassostreae]|uniref:MBL fold metallo-hydrolase n=1 Tax=Flavobacterium crassostreae TaxID=1763534 RepID=A0A1B9DXS8_9FLAO|nr:MBL fold metallo-hydrolase [Flavobacterium crassostreae]OCB74488.1 MBL fold metallo-hydrolase [Flavobacterium crassostreae]
MKVTFIGGAGTVTGSKTLLESNGKRILIDCGLFQGIKPLRELNWKPLAVLASTIDCVLLTHGHLDHCGWLPLLVEQGFSGKIYCSNPTMQVAKLILSDSAKIQEEEAKKANKEKFSKHQVAKPLYTVAQALNVFPLFHVIQTEQPILLTKNISARFFNAGHIIGACSIALELEDKTLFFSGDIGRDQDVLMFPPTKPKNADYVFLESTYGNRLHPDSNAKLELAAAINATLNNQGTFIIPSFAIERAQSIMYLLWQLKNENKIPDVPYIIDSPMGVHAFSIFLNNSSWHKSTLQDCVAMGKMFTMITDYKDTLAAIDNKQPKVVIAASGMVTGGRVLNYLQEYIGQPQTTIMLVGYQAEGTRGRKLVEGAKEVKIYGKYYPVVAKIMEIKGLSAHGDQKDLLHWLSELKNTPKKVFLVHGENQAADELRIKINQEYGYDCCVPLMNEEMVL